MNIFNTIKSQLNIVDVISDYITLKRTGAYFKGNCPLHHERTASFTVTPVKEIFYCFGCRLGGDVIAFITHAEKCSPREAVRHLAERYKLTLPSEEQDLIRGNGWTEQQRYYALCEKIATWCHAQLSSSTNARTYLSSRFISDTSISRYLIGYLPSGERARKKLLGILQKDGFLLEDLYQTKFMMPGKHGTYSPFEERIIFPIKDGLGRYCGFGGRVFTPQDDRPKYYNSHDHTYFNKGSLLFGLDLAKRSIQQSGSVYLVEGYTDCIAVAQSGITNVVATLGTACTPDHLKLISRYSTHLRVVYDSDTAGKDASLRLGELCWNEGIELSIIQLPPNEDPASYLAQNNDLIALPAIDIMAFYLTSLQDKFHQQSLAEKLVHIKELLSRIATIEDPLKRELVLEQAARICAIPHATLSREMARMRLPSTKTAPHTALPSTPQKTQKEISRFATTVFCAILNWNGALDREYEEIIRTLLPPTLKQLFNKLIEFKQSTDRYCCSDFFTILLAEEQATITQLIVNQHIAPQETEHVEELLSLCRSKYWKYAVHVVKEEIREAQTQHNTARIAELMKKFDNLKKSLYSKGTYHENEKKI